MLCTFDAGAVGYCHALAVPDLLRQVAVVVANGGLWLGPELMRRMIGSVTSALDRGPAPAATPHSTRCRRASAQWWSRQPRAPPTRKLPVRSTSPSARSRQHLGSAFGKLGVRDRLQLVLRLKTEPGVLEPAA